MNLVKNSFYTLLSTASPILVGLVSVPIYLHTIGLATYGIMAILLSALGYLGFLDLGLGKALTQKIASLSESQSRRKEYIVSAATIITFVLCAIGCLLVWLVLKNTWILGFISADAEKVAANYSPYIIGFIPLILFTSVYQGVLQAESRFLELGVIQMF